MVQRIMIDGNSVTTNGIPESGEAEGPTITEIMDVDKDTTQNQTTPVVKTNADQIPESREVESPTIPETTENQTEPKVESAPNDESKKNE